MVYTTMSTIVREQTREIGIMKAVGGSRRAITRSYLLVALLLGGAGTMLGIVAGVFLSNLLVGFAGRQFSGIEAGFGLPLVGAGPQPGRGARGDDARRAAGDSTGDGPPGP